MLQTILRWTAIGFAAQLAFAFVYYGLRLDSNLWWFGAVLPCPWGLGIGLVVGLVIATSKSPGPDDKS